MTFWERLSNLMKEKKVTAKKATQDLHISKDSFTYWKQNGNIPKGDTLELLAEYFDCSIDYLLGKTDIKKEQTTHEEQSGSINVGDLVNRILNLTNEQIETVTQFVEFLESKNDTKKYNS